MTALADPVLPPWETPGALQEHKTRQLPAGAVVEFEQAPRGWITKDGNVRQKDHRAYYYTPQPTCPACNATGRVPSEKRPGNTIQCKTCKGTGDGPRTQLISVTTLLDAICPKGGLPSWAEARGIEGALEAFRRGEMTVNTDPLDAIKLVRLLKLGADNARDTAADRGINIHALVEHYMRTGEPPRHDDHPVEHHGYITSVCGWLLKVDPEPEEIETLVCHPAAGYAGRRDLVARAGGFRKGYDFKSQERGQIFSSAHLQLRMYEDAAVVSGDDPCDFLEVVVFPADGGEAREMPCAASSDTLAAALAYYEMVKPINSLCESWNRAARAERA
jgi:hypothetical protein